MAWHKPSTQYTVPKYATISPIAANNTYTIQTHCRLAPVPFTQDPQDHCIRGQYRSPWEHTNLFCTKRHLPDYLSSYATTPPSVAFNDLRAFPRSSSMRKLLASNLPQIRFYKNTKYKHLLVLFSSLSRTRDASKRGNHSGKRNRS